MNTYPLLLDLHDRLCVVVGGGAVGMRKVRGLLTSGARVRLIDPQNLPGMEPTVHVDIVHRPFVPTDLEGAYLVFAATNDRGVNESIAREARSKKILVSIVDAPEESDFTLPAILRRGEMTVTVSTGGRSPALSALARDRLSELLEPGWEDAVAIAAALRQKRLTGQQKGEYNQMILRRLFEGGLLSLIASEDLAGIDRLLESVVGKGVSLASLGLHKLKKG